MKLWPESRSLQRVDTFVGFGVPNLIDAGLIPAAGAPHLPGERTDPARPPLLTVRGGLRVAMLPGRSQSRSNDSLAIGPCADGRIAQW